MGIDNGSNNIRLGKNWGSLDLNALKSGIKRTDLNADQQTIFDKIDTDQNGVLTRDEIESLQQILSDYTDDGKISKRDAKKIIKNNPQFDGIEKKELLTFLKEIGGGGAIDTSKLLQVNEYDDPKTKTPLLQLIYNANENGETIKETLRKSDGTKYSTEVKTNGKTVTKYFDETGKTVTKEVTVENGTTTILDYLPSGAIGKTVIRGTEEKVYINDKLQKSILDKGSGVIETSEFIYDETGNPLKIIKTSTADDNKTIIEKGEDNSTIYTTYDKSGNVLSTKTKHQDGTIVIVENGVTETKNPDGTTIINDGKEIKTTAKDGSYTIENIETGKITKFDKSGKEIIENQSYNVQYGDTWYGIVQAKYGITDHNQTMAIVRELKSQNNVDPKATNMPKTIQLPEKIKLADGTEIELNMDGKVDNKHNNVTNKDHSLNKTPLTKNDDVTNGTQSTNPKSSLTNPDISYVKDKDGKVTYYNKDGQPLTEEEVQKFIQQEAEFVFNQIKESSIGRMGTDEKGLSAGINNIYSSEILAVVDEKIKTEGNISGDEMSTPLEALLLSELSHQEVISEIKTLRDNGAYGDKASTDEAMIRNATREIENEIDGRTKIEDLKNAMELISNSPEAREGLETSIKERHPNLEPDNGSYVRALIKDDGWNAQKIDYFDAVWVKNNSYAQATYKTDANGQIMLDAKGQPIIEDMGDQEHRNGVISRLAFEHADYYSVLASVDAIDTSSFNNETVHSQDYLAFEQGCIKANQEKGYQPQFKGQDPIQTYLSAVSAEGSEVLNKKDLGEISALNTVLYKQTKPVDVQAQEAILNAKAGNPGAVFELTSPKAYEEVSKLLQNGAIDGVNNLEELFKSITPQNNTIKANAILSGQIKFSDEEITNTCIELMHMRDKYVEEARQAIGGVGHSSDKAEELKLQIEQIIIQNPQIKDGLNTKIREGKFEYSVRNSDGYVTHQVSTQGEYFDLTNNADKIVNEQVFLDENGDKITDQATINALVEANKASLAELRDYVSELEREFKISIDKEGSLSDAANFLGTQYGTSRDDIANELREAKMLLTKMEAATEGRLRDSEGNVISAQDLANEVITKGDELVQTKASYDKTISTGKMAIVMAPVIAATAAASGVASVALAGSSLAGTTVASGITAVVGGGASGLTTLGMSAIERKTSFTGDTAEAKQNAREEAAVNAIITSVTMGVGMKTDALARSGKTAVQSFVNKAEAVGIDIGTDAFISAATEFFTSGTVNEDAFIQNMAYSVVGSGLGHALASKADVKAPDTPETVLKKATVDGKNLSGGKLNDNKFSTAQQEVKDIAQKGSVDDVVNTYEQIQHHSHGGQAQVLRNSVHDENNIVRIGQERIDIATASAEELQRARKHVQKFADGTRNKDELLKAIDARQAELDNPIKSNLSQPARSTEVKKALDNRDANKASEILVQPKGQIYRDQIPTLESHLQNNLNTVEDIENFIGQIKNRVGMDDSGKMHVYQEEGTDWASELIKKAEAKAVKIKNHQADYAQVNNILSNAQASGKGLSGEEMGAIKAFMQKTDSVEELQNIANGLKKTKQSDSSRKMIKQINEKIEMLEMKKASASKPVQDNVEVKPEIVNDKKLTDDNINQFKNEKFTTVDDMNETIKAQGFEARPFSSGENYLEYQGKVHYMFVNKETGITKHFVFDPGSGIEPHRIFNDEVDIKIDKSANEVRNNSAPEVINSRKENSILNNITRENIGDVDLATLQNNLKEQGIEAKIETTTKKQGLFKKEQTTTVKYTQNGVEYYLVYDKNGKCELASSVGDGKSMDIQYEQGKPVREIIRTYTRKADASIPLKETIYNKDGSKVVTDYEHNKKTTYASDGKEIHSEKLWDNSKSKVEERKISAEEQARLDANEKELNLIWNNNPATMSDDEIQFAINKLKNGNYTEYFDKNGNKIPTNVDNRLDKLEIELKKRNLQPKITGENSQVMSLQFPETGVLSNGTSYKLDMNNLPEFTLANQVTLDLNEPSIKSKITQLQPGQKLTIGRAGDIQIDDITNHVSRKHLEIENVNGQIVIRDISTGGTKLASKNDDIKVEIYEKANESQISNDLDNDDWMIEIDQYYANELYDDIIDDIL